MKAAFKTLEGTFEIGEAEVPAINNDDWVVAKVKTAGICGTDLRHWKQKEPDLEHTASTKRACRTLRLI